MIDVAPENGRRLGRQNRENRQNRERENRENDGRIINRINQRFTSSTKSRIQALLN